MGQELSTVCHEDSCLTSSPGMYKLTHKKNKLKKAWQAKNCKKLFFHLDRGMYAIDFATEEAADRLRSYFGASAEFQRDHTGEAVYAGEVDVPLVNFIYRVSKQLLEKVGNEGTFLQIYQEFLDITTQAQVRTGKNLSNLIDQIAHLLWNWLLCCQRTSRFAFVIQHWNRNGENNQTSAAKDPTFHPAFEIFPDATFPQNETFKKKEQKKLNMLRESGLFFPTKKF